MANLLNTGPLTEGEVTNYLKNKPMNIKNSVKSVLPSIMNNTKTTTTTAFFELKDPIPRNMSIGTRQICVGNEECVDLPFKFSTLVNFPGLLDILRDNAESEIQTSLDQLNPLVKPISILTSVIGPCYIVGLVLLLLIAGLNFSLIFNKLLFIANLLLCLNPCSRVIIQMLLGLCLCGPFIFLAAVFQVIQKEGVNSPDWADCRLGGLHRLVVGTLVLTVLLALVSSLAPLVV